jgi:hypothetical protein
MPPEWQATRFAWRSVSSAQQRYPERADFPEGVAAADYRILLHHLPRGLLVGSIEDDQAGVDRAQRRAGEDEPAVSQQALQSLEMLRPDVFSSAVIVAAKSSRGGWMK